MTYPNVIPPPPSQIYIPRVFGFRVRRDIAALIDNNSETSAAAASADHEPPPPSAEMSRITAKLGTLGLAPSGTRGIAPVRAIGVSGISPSMSIAAQAGRLGSTSMGRTTTTTTTTTSEVTPITISQGILDGTGISSPSQSSPSPSNQKVTTSSVDTKKNNSTPSTITSPLNDCTTTTSIPK
jgi:hypothetical protein